MHQRRIIPVFLATLFLTCFLAFGVAFAQSPTVQTDKADYAPGETVVISGSGWSPGETVVLTLEESPLIDTHGPYSSIADADGNFTNADFAVNEEDRGVAFTLTATGQSSGWTAETRFTDSSSQITKIGFNGVNQPASFTVGCPNVTSSPLRVQSQNGGGTGEDVTDTGKIGRAACRGRV